MKRVLCATVIGVCAAGGTAVAASDPGPLADLPASPSVPVSEFYTPPSPLPVGKRGDVIRVEELPALPGVASVRRIMYLSKNQQGEKVPVTGVILTPIAAETASVRPIVVHTPGTRGLADSCAPSNFYDPASVKDPRNIEAVQMPGYLQPLAAGVTVVVTDYLGSGTPLQHEYLVAESEARNGIDAMRAALRLDPGDNMNQSSPLGFFGVSQGGQAAAGIAEQLSTYGRGLLPQVKGVVAGGPVTDMQEQLAYGDGNPAVSGAMFAALVGLDTAFPDLNLDNYMTSDGKKVFERVRAACAGEELAGFGTIRYDQVLEPDVTKQQDWRAAMAESKLGTRAPRVPTYLFNGTNDEIVPPHMAPTLYNDWCSKGATSEFVSYPGTEHVGSLVAVGVPAANTWLLDRLAGKPADNKCGTVTTAARANTKLIAKVTSRTGRAFTVRGRLLLPKGTAKAAGCKGRIAIKVTRRGQPVTTRRVAVRKNCRFSAKRSFARQLTRSGGQLRFELRFRGNTVADKASLVRRVSFGRRRA